MTQEQRVRATKALGGPYKVLFSGDAVRDLTDDQLWEEVLDRLELHLRTGAYEVKP